MVWFNQATMFQSSELNTTSIKALLQKHKANSGTTPEGVTVHTPAGPMIQQGFFSVA